MATKAKKAKATKKKAVKSVKLHKPKKVVKKTSAKKKVKAAKKPVKNQKITAPKKKPTIKTKSKSNTKSKAKMTKMKKSEAPKKIKAKEVKVKTITPSKKIAEPKEPKLRGAIAKAVVKKIKAPVRVAKPFGLFHSATESPIDTSIEIPPYQEKPGEEYMNDKQREHFRRILLQRKQQIIEEMGRTVHHLQDEAANFPDPNDRATQEEEFSLELRTRDRERKFIKNIEDALRKLEEGEYGYCNVCGVEIGIRRLEARPTADLCIDCKTLDEIREKQMGG
jgi:DnaK suppressor protein